MSILITSVMSALFFGRLHIAQHLFLARVKQTRLGLGTIVERLAVEALRAHARRAARVEIGIAEHNLGVEFHLACVHVRKVRNVVS